MRDKAIIISAIAPIFEQPMPKASLADEVLHGMIVEVLRHCGEFYYIKTAYGYRGYARASDLKNYKDDPFVSVYEKIPTHRVRACFADVLDGRNVRAAVVATLPRGAEVLASKNLEGSINGYVPVTLADGKTYYMRREALELPIAEQDEETLRSKLVNTAKKYLGTQYRWGGKTGMGIDCSGLVFMAYWINGVTIWRDAIQKKGYPVTKIGFDMVKPGDLVYFPEHVAMLIENGKIIHSCHRNNGVRIESLDPAESGFRQDLYENILHAGTVFESVL